MKRTLINELSAHVGATVGVRGWISVRRDQGKLVFFDVRDMTGTVQCVVLPKSAAITVAKDVSIESSVAITGTLNKRPEKNVQAGKQNGDIELAIDSIEILNLAQTLPFELDAEVNLDTLLDHRPLTLRSERSRDIFSVQATILNAYRNALIKRNFTEFQAPVLVGADSEGGAAAFKVNYYYDTTAYLATSPQFYKEIMVNPFERAFTIAKIFRGEKHATPRHVSELTQMDFEMGFIDDHLDVMAVLRDVVRDVVAAVEEKHKDVFERFGVSVPKTPPEFPILKLAEAQELVSREFNRPIEDTNDMSPEDERQVCEWAYREHGSDFVFITAFPTAKRAFYTYEDPHEAPYSRGFDLLFRGLEINSGSQRMHDYNATVERIQSRGMDPALFSFYLQAHKYGIPPHGGCSTGLERFTARMLQLPNIREATAFPRDMTRIDTRLSKETE